MPPNPVQINGIHAITNDSVFTALRLSHFERRDFDVLYRLPKPNDAPQPSSVILGDIWDLHWIRPAAPFMLLVPMNRRPFDGPLLSRLNYVHSIPLQQNDDRSWSLRSDFIRDWHILELNLHAVWWAMLKKSDGMSPKDLRYWAWPHRYGYHLRYRCRSHANIIATRSRNAFIPLMASLTFFIIQLDYFAQRHGGKFVDWRDDVILEANIHPQWFADMENSVIGDLSAPRVGGIVEVSGCQFLWLLPMLRKFNMPLLLHWGPSNDLPQTIPDWLEPLAPNLSVISQLRSLERNFTGRPYSPQPNLPPPIFPPVEPYSGQRQDEDIKAFFERRNREERQRIQDETPQQRQSRLQRDASTARHQAPGKRGARVYYWEDVNGFRIRKAAGRQHYDSYWEEDGDYRRRYSAVFNEWDICSEFSDSEASDDVDVDANPDVDTDLHVANVYPLLPENEEFLQFKDQFSSSIDLEHIHSIDTPSETQEPADVSQTTHVANDVAFSRFGFTYATTNEETPRESWACIAKVLGVSWSDNSLPSPKVRNAMESFFGCHKMAKTYKDLPPDLYDLLDDEADIHRRKLDVQRRTLGEQEFFLLSTPGHQNAFKLGLTSAAAVVQVLRSQCGPDLSEVAHELLTRGIGFRTFIQGNSNPPPRERFFPRFRGLGYRPTHYRPDTLDYAAYVCRRNQLLSSPRGRAALLHGGLIARFARGVVKFDDVLDGPSSNVTQDGRLFADARTRGVGFWDDCLTQDEIAVLCGVYQVDTGELPLLSHIRS